MAKIFRNRNIRKNKEVLKELGLPVSKRKFDRHVPNTDKAVESNCTSPQKEEIQSEQLVNGEEVYLLIEKKYLRQPFTQKKLTLSTGFLFKKEKVDFL